LCYVPTAEMLVDCFIKPLPKPAFLQQIAEMGMVGIGLGNGLWIGIGHHIRNGIVIGHGNGIGIGNGEGIRNAVGQ
jgi:hypothetical protein